MFSLTHHSTSGLFLSSLICTGSSLPGLVVVLLSLHFYTAPHLGEYLPTSIEGTHQIFRLPSSAIMSRSSPFCPIRIMVVRHALLTSLYSSWNSPSDWPEASSSLHPIVAMNITTFFLRIIILHLLPILNFRPVNLRTISDVCAMYLSFSSTE